jgi:hypothetical protein
MNSGPNNIPGFTADASLYGARRHYCMHSSWPGDLAGGLLLMPALRIGVQTGGKSCSARCADAANNCTSACRPEDSACRDNCDSAFWCCLTGCGIGVGMLGTVAF